jgi:hypothetical protein
MAHVIQTGCVEGPRNHGNFDLDRTQRHEPSGAFESIERAPQNFFHEIVLQQPIGAPSNFEEVANVCHRALVFDRGQVVAELSGAELTIEKLLAAASASGARELIGEVAYNAVDQVTSA